MTRERGQDLVGHHVTVTNPRLCNVWRGRAIAYSQDPTILIELDDGGRMMLPAAWAQKDAE